MHDKDGRTLSIRPHLILECTVRNGVRSLACKSRTPSVPAVSTNDRFHHLEIEESEECIADEASITEPQISKTCSWVLLIISDVLLVIFLFCHCH